VDCDFRSSTRRQLRRLSAQDTVTPGREREREHVTCVSSAAGRGGAPMMALLRFSTVLPMGWLVQGSPTSCRNSRWPWAWPVSPSAVLRKTAATSGNRSTLM